MNNANTFTSLGPLLKDTYPEEKKKQYFQRLRQYFQGGIVGNMAEADKDPEKFIKKTENMSISGLKGIAF